MPSFAYSLARNVSEKNPRESREHVGLDQDQPVDARLDAPEAHDQSLL